MKTRYLLAFLVIIISSCNCLPKSIQYTITGMEYVPKQISVCIQQKIGDVTTYIPTHGGVCAGVVEMVSEKYLLYYTDGGEQISEYVSKNKYDSSYIGGVITKEEIVCE